ncbi:hypothetical protein KSF78_0009657 [Schistosoma japonicum]|nr:hypothetical protein KSF78_0009657 [Schistosoma japonicum]
MFSLFLIPCEFDENILQVSNLLASLTWRLKKYLIWQAKVIVKYVNRICLHLRIIYQSNQSFCVFLTSKC